MLTPPRDTQVKKHTSCGLITAGCCFPDVGMRAFMDTPCHCHAGNVWPGNLRPVGPADIMLNWEMDCAEALCGRYPNLPSSTGKS